MEYNYEDKEKMENLEKDPKYKKQQKKKILTLGLYCLPFLIGSTLYISFCNITPKYVSIFKNMEVDFSANTSSYYSLEKDADIFLTNLTKVDGNEYTTYDSFDLVTIDLVSLKESNFDYQEFMITFTYDSLESYPVLDYKTTTNQSYGLSVDGVNKETKTASKIDEYEHYSFDNIELSKTASKVTLNITKWSTKTAINSVDENNTTKMYFKNIRLYVYGAK